MPSVGAVPVVWAFPNTYTVGITSLGYQWIWGMLAQRTDVRVSRWFTDGGEPVPEPPELLGFSCGWELDYPHIFDLLEQFGIPLLSRERENHHPLVFGGGPVLSANPEPFANFFDVILLGDGEELIPNFLDHYQEIRQSDRLEKLLKLAQIPGVYVPQFYQPIYTNITGAIETIIPHPDAPSNMQPQATATQLCYLVHLRPRASLPVRLIEGRITRGIQRNLLAIRERVNQLVMT